MATEKRFTSERTDDYNFSDILDNGKWIGICHIDSADDFVRKFNELSEKNEQLKKVLSDVAKDHEVIVEDLILWNEGLITELEKENEQLKQELQKCKNDLEYKINVQNATIEELKSDIKFWKFEYQNRVNEYKKASEEILEISNLVADIVNEPLTSSQRIIVDRIAKVVFK